MVKNPVRTTAALIAISAMLFVGWMFFLFNEEDYYPEPRTFTFYLKLSSLVRDIPIVDAVSVPTYHGSTGDGPKPAQSSVCYRAQRSREVRVVATTGSYLHKRGFSMDRIETNPRIIPVDGPRPLHLTAYASKEGQSVHLMLSSSPGSEQVEVCLTHYE